MAYADWLMEFPSGVLGVALGTILAVVIVESFCQRQIGDEYRRLMHWGAAFVLLPALPSAVALGILAKPLDGLAVSVYGKLPFDAAMTQRALIAYSVG